jgi:hypothetical protein
MAVRFTLKSGGCKSQSVCVDKFGCPPDTCPDFAIRRHDTRPSFRVAVDDCDGPLDLQALVIEANMWALAKLKTDMDANIAYLSLADGIGFEQIMIGDIIVMDRVRLPEHMLVIGFDEENKLVHVQRAYHATTASSWKKGTKLRIFRIMGAQASGEATYEDIQHVDGTTEKDVLTGSFLVYEWQPEDTCLPGCYWFEFKVLKMIDVVWFLPGGYWTGEVVKHTDGFFYTGSTFTDSSVRLSYDQVADKYFLPTTPWSGETVLHTDDNYYTGSLHNDGSVILDKSDVPSDANTAYNEDGQVSALSIIPSFSSPSLTPSDYGCVLGEGVESVRRFPLEGEGFLIQIVDSPTTEM